MQRKDITTYELNKLLKNHKIWLDNKKKGEQVDFSKCILEKMNFHDLNLKGVSFKDSQIINCSFYNTDLRLADFTMSNLVGSDFTNANLSGAKLNSTNMSDTIFKNASLARSDVSNATMINANLEGANLSNIKFVKNKYFFHMKKISQWSFKETPKFIGIRLFSSYGSPRFVRYAKDQEFIEEVRDSHPYISLLWWITSDYGQSLFRWSLWSLFFSIIFAVIYYNLGISNFNLSGFEELSFPIAIYFSIVTFTTLGFGDIIPISEVAAMFIIIEVIIGYMMLGGLISIFANLIARRS